MEAGSTQRSAAADVKSGSLRKDAHTEAGSTQRAFVVDGAWHVQETGWRKAVDSGLLGALADAPQHFQMSYCCMVVG
jgi:hypothetical protein